jgi:hypothetical protein
MIIGGIMGLFGTKILINEQEIKLTRRERDILAQALKNITIQVNGAEQEIKDFKKFKETISKLKECIEFITDENNYTKRPKNGMVEFDVDILKDKIKMAKVHVEELNKIYKAMVEIIKNEWELLTETNQLMQNSINAIEAREQQIEQKKK